MSQPLISIIMPAYNPGPEMERALLSVGQQDYSQLEVVVVDDGSDFLVQEKFEKSAPMGTKWLRTENRGGAAARNFGFKNSLGGMVFFWDADVVGEKKMMSTLQSMLDRHPRASYAYCNYYLNKVKMPARAFEETELRQKNYISNMSLIRREDFPLFDESLRRFIDWDLWLTLLESGKSGIHVPEYLFKCLPHPKAISAWLPSFAYKAPWRWLPVVGDRVRSYEEARKIIINKHHLS